MSALAGRQKGDLQSRALRNDRVGMGRQHSCNDALFFCPF